MLNDPIDEYSAGYARSIAPATIAACVGVTSEQVREMLAKARSLALGASSRLLRFDRRDEAGRKQLWEAGPEFHWFADYDRAKLTSLKRVFDRIGEILGSDRLDVVCDLADPGYAHANPGIWKIHLGRQWVHDNDRQERIQTFVHEAAHIAGRSVAMEGASKRNPTRYPGWYGKPLAHAQAHKHRRLRPRMALRSADNIGYYAVDADENLLKYLGTFKEEATT